MTTADRQTKTLLLAYSAVVAVSLLVAVAGYWYFLAAFPLLVLYAYLAVVDFRKLFYLLLAFLPITVEVWLPNGTVTDLPTEPMMVSLMGIWIAYVLQRGTGLPQAFLSHPLTLLLLLHLGWMFVTVLTSQAFVVSAKFFLAKLWYVATFYFLAGRLLRSERDLRAVVWVVLPPLLFTIGYVLLRHASYGFSFANVHKVMHPFYRNKVMYACMLVVFLPFVWYALRWYRRWSLLWWILTLATAVILVGVQFSYTRAAYASLVFAAGAYFIIRWRLMKVALAAVFLLFLLFVASQLRDRQWLDEKPQYEKAITHERFDDLLSATTRGQDVSTMERVYRWVAAGHMIAERPWLGFGPGTFTTFYKSYTVFGFRTYVSDNKEGSGIHSYYLQTIVDQGVAGLLLFIAMLTLFFLKAEQLYHRINDPARRRLLLMVTLTMVVIASLLLMNDLVETDKIGSFFFMCMAVLVNLDVQSRGGSESG